MTRFKSFYQKSKGKVKTLGILATTLLVSSPVFAADADTSSMVTSLTDGFTSCKTEFLTIAGVAVTAGMGIYVVKFAINQGISFFSKIAKK